MHEIELEFGMLVFEEGGKPVNPEKNPRGKDENQQQTQLTYERRVRKTNPGHISGKRALSPLRHPCSRIICEIPCQGSISKPRGLDVYTFRIPEIG